MLKFEKDFINHIQNSFILFSSKRLEKNLSTYKTYYILGRRANYYIVNPHAVTEILNRIFILVRGIASETKNFSK
jgi:hypothetical protein